MKAPRSCFALLLLHALAFAQSPEKPVLVVNEPCHKVTLENAWLRMLDVRVPADATTLYHVHTIPSVVVRISNANIVSQDWGAPPSAPSISAPGESRYAPYDEKPLTHRVTNRGPGVFHVLDIELLRSPADAALAPPSAPPELKLEWEQKLVRFYRAALASGKEFAVPRNGCAHLVISVYGNVQATTDSATNKASRELKAGEYLFFAPQSRIQVDNRGQEPASCIVLELK